MAPRNTSAVQIPSFLTRRSLVNRALDAQDIAQQREDRLSSKDAWEQAIKEQQLTARADSAESRAIALQDQNEAMNQIRQQQTDVQQKLSDLKDASTQAQLQKQNYDLDRQVRAERDAAAYLKQVSGLDPASPTYRKDVTSALASNPLALESKPAMEHFQQAAEDSRKYADQAFHLANIGKEEQAKIDAEKGIIRVKTINGPQIDTATQQPKLDKDGNVIMTTSTSQETVVPNTPPVNPVAVPVPNGAPVPAVPVSVDPNAAPPTIAPVVPAVQVGGVSIGNPNAVPLQNSPVIQDNSESAISQRYFGK